MTTFTAGADQTLPIWILNNLSRPNQLPIVNVVAVFVILLSMIPVYFAVEALERVGGRRRDRRRRCADGVPNERCPGRRSQADFAAACYAALRAAAGSSTKKVEPSPSFDSTQIFPSIRRTSSRQM